MRTRPLLAAFTVASALIAANPSFAAWTNPFPLSDASGDAASPAIGLDPVGNAIIVYREAGGTLFLNTRAPDGTIGTRVPVNNVRAGPPSLAVNPAGAAAIAWQESDGVNSRLHLRLRRANGSFVSPQIISQAGTDVYSIEIGIDNAGDVFVSWGAVFNGANRTFLRVRNGASGALSPIQSISPGTGTFIQPHMAVEPAGKAFLTYVSSGASGERVFGRLRSAAGVLSAAAAFSGTSTIIESSVALGATGTALVAWSFDIGGVARAQARTRAANGALSTTVTLSAVGAAASEVRAAISNNGNVGVVAWRRLVGPDVRLQARRLVGGVWQSAAETVSPPLTTVLEFRVGLSGTGDRAIFVFADTDRNAVQRIRAHTRNADGTYGPNDIVSSETTLPAISPRLAVSASGQAAAAWVQQQIAVAGNMIWVGTNFL